jgi:butyrate kinase
VPAGDFRVLAINPGSVSTKIGVYTGDHADWLRCAEHAAADLEPFRGKSVLEQLAFRQAAIEQELRGAGYALEGFAAVAGRGGLMRPVASGTYRVNEALLDDLRTARFGKEHAANLGAFLALAIAKNGGAQAFVVDPVSVDELVEKARISGSALVERRSLSHVLNTKAVARRFAREQCAAYEDLRLVVAHLGSGVSVSAHAGGRMVDVNLGGQEGAFSTERCGGLQLMSVLELCFSGRYSERALWDALIREGGIYSYLGTKDLREVERRIAAGDRQATLVFDALAYQLAKDIGSMATVLEGRLDAILLTGGMARSKKLIVAIRSAVEWIAPVTVYPGEDELEALAAGALRVLRGEEKARELLTLSPAA